MVCKFDVSVNYLILFSTRLVYTFYLCSIYFLTNPNYAELTRYGYLGSLPNRRCDLYLYLFIIPHWDSFVESCYFTHDL